MYAGDPCGVFVGLCRLCRFSCFFFFLLFVIYKLGFKKIYLRHAQLGNFRAIQLTAEFLKKVCRTVSVSVRLLVGKFYCP